MSVFTRPVVRAGTFAALVGALAYRFAIIYRVRAGQPRRRMPVTSPADRGMAFESIAIRSAGNDLPGWFIPARDGAPGPGVVLVHGWESNRDRTLPNAQFLHAAGFHVLTFDVRGHGANAAEQLPISVGEFRDDALAAFETLVCRPVVTAAGFLGHSLGAVGADLAAAELGKRCAALVSVSAPADPRRLTRQTFRLAGLPIPEPIASPLAELTSRVYVQPRGHRVRDLSTVRALRAYGGPILLIHGDADTVVPPSHLGRLEQAARAGVTERLRAGLPAGGPVLALRISEGNHSWLYELPAYRRTVARFLAESLGGPYPPDEAGRRAEDTDSPRITEPEEWFAAVTNAPSRRRTVRELIGAAAPSAPSGLDR